MLDTLYSAKILGYAGNIERIGNLPSPDAISSKTSAICGSTVKVEIASDGQIILDFAQSVEACALGQAACAIVAEKVVGATYEQVLEAKESFEQMLQGENVLPQGRFEALKYLEAVKEHPNRHASCLLVLECVLDAMEQIQTKNVSK